MELLDKCEIGLFTPSHQLKKLGQMAAYIFVSLTFVEWIGLGLAAIGFNFNQNSSTQSALISFLFYFIFGWT